MERLKSTHRLLIRLLVCIGWFGLFLYLYLHQHNQLLEVRYQLPKLQQNVAEQEEETVRLSYELEQWSHPRHLLKLAQRPEFGHLVFPSSEAILFLTEEESGEPD